MMGNNQSYQHAVADFSSSLLEAQAVTHQLDARLGHQQSGFPPSNDNDKQNKIIGHHTYAQYCMYTAPIVMQVGFNAAIVIAVCIRRMLQATAVAHSPWNGGNG